MKSWKTTFAGLATIGAACLAVGASVLDGNPETLPNWTAFGAAVSAGVCLLMARDNSKSSESVGAK